MVAFLHYLPSQAPVLCMPAAWFQCHHKVLHTYVWTVLPQCTGPSRNQSISLGRAKLQDTMIEFKHKMTCFRARNFVVAEVLLLLSCLIELLSLQLVSILCIVSSCNALGDYNTSYPQFRAFLHIANSTVPMLHSNAVRCTSSKMRVYSLT